MENVQKTQLKGQYGKLIQTHHQRAYKRNRKTWLAIKTVDPID